MELRHNGKYPKFQNQIPMMAYGVYLTPSEIQKIDKKIEELKELCPSQAGISLNYQQHENIFTGSLKVNSPTRSFEARKIGDHPVEVLDELINSIKDQLNNWKKSRVFKF